MARNLNGYYPRLRIYDDVEEFPVFKNPYAYILFSRLLSWADWSGENIGFVLTSYNEIAQKCCIKYEQSRYLVKRLKDEGLINYTANGKGLTIECIHLRQMMEELSDKNKPKITANPSQNDAKMSGKIPNKICKNSGESPTPNCTVSDYNEINIQDHEKNIPNNFLKNSDNSLKYFPPSEKDKKLKNLKTHTDTTATTPSTFINDPSSGSDCVCLDFDHFSENTIEILKKCKMKNINAIESFAKNMNITDAFTQATAAQMLGKVESGKRIDSRDSYFTSWLKKEWEKREIKNDNRKLAIETEQIKIRDLYGNEIIM